MNQDPLINTFNYYSWYYKQSLKDYQENKKQLDKIEKEILNLVLEKKYHLIDNLNYNNIKKIDEKLSKNLSGFTKIYNQSINNIRESSGFDLIEN